MEVCSTSRECKHYSKDDLSKQILFARMKVRDLTLLSFAKCMTLVISTQKTPICDHANLQGSYFCTCFTDDCAVIDEIQMIAESERGFAWTKALLGNTFKIFIPRAGTLRSCLEDLLPAIFYRTEQFHCPEYKNENNQILVKRIQYCFPRSLTTAG